MKAHIKFKTLQSGEYPRVSRVQDSGAEPMGLTTRNVYLYLQQDAPHHITILESTRLPKGTVAMARGSAVYINPEALKDKPVAYVAALAYQAALHTYQNQRDPTKRRELDAISQTLEWISRRLNIEKDEVNIAGLNKAKVEVEKYRGWVNKNMTDGVPSNVRGM
jgi:hypothetical protein